MPSLREGMRNKSISSINSGTLSDFGMLFKHTGLSGACDIDFIYEKGGLMVVGEGKEVYDDAMIVPIGQHIMLKALSNSSNIQQVFFVGYKKGAEKTYYICGIQTFNEKARWSTKKLPSGSTQKVMKINVDDMAGPFSERVMAHKVNNYVEQINDAAKKAKFNTNQV